MNPRLIAYAIALAGLIWTGWWLNGRLDRANEADRIEQEMASLRQQIAKDATLREKAAKDMADLRAAEARLQADLAAIPKEKLVYVPKPVPGQPIPSGPCPRLSDDFLRSYNAAVTGQAR